MVIDVRLVRGSGDGMVVVVEVAIGECCWRRTPAISVPPLSHAFERERDCQRDEVKSVKRE